MQGQIIDAKWRTMSPSPTASAAVRPAWVDDRLLPFQSRFLTLRGHTVHYLDEGHGPLLLLLHGNPTWSFLYRDMIRELKADFRCVALDYPGFGLSTAAADYTFLPEEHATIVEAFIEALDLTDITLMIQDWGGPIGLAAASRNPERFTAFIIGNTWAWPITGDRHFEWFSHLLGGWIGTRLIQRFNLFVNLLIPRGHTRRKLTKAEMEHYRRPFPTPTRRTPTAVFPRRIAQGTAFLASVERGLANLTHLPALIVWGDKDIAFRAQERTKFELLFPDHSVHILRDAGHYVQDDAGDEIARAITSWHPTRVG